jgi:hypothetical protein
MLVLEVREWYSPGNPQKEEVEKEVIESTFTVFHVDNPSPDWSLILACTS